MWSRILLCTCAVLASASEHARADDPQISISTRLYTVFVGDPAIRVVTPISTVFIGQGATVWSRQISCELICIGDLANDFGFTINEGGGPDGKVDFGDFVGLLGLIGDCPDQVPGCLGDFADDFGFNQFEGGGPDGIVDFGDFVALLGLIGNCLPE